MSADFFKALDLESPDEYLGVGSGSQAEQTADGLVAIERLLEAREPEAVIAQGDTNAVLSTAIGASKLPVEFGHIEAGIRSHDRSMPEEINRTLADHVADLCFAPTTVAVEHLSAEGINDGVYETGNTIVDACLEHHSIAESESEILSEFQLTAGEYAVATIHRARNTDDCTRLRTILKAFDSQEFPVVFPCHPRSKTVIDALGFQPSGSLILVDPLDYLDFLKLEANARLIVTDSGGVQEEASILGIPCLTVRPNTERPETIQAGVNRLIEPMSVREAMEELFFDDDRHREMQGAQTLYGDGTSAEKIVRIMEERYI